MHQLHSTELEPGTTVLCLSATLFVSRLTQRRVADEQRYDAAIWEKG
jgi:hypothetical protein